MLKRRVVRRWAVPRMQSLSSFSFNSNNSRYANMENMTLTYTDVTCGMTILRESQQDRQDNEPEIPSTKHLYKKQLLRCQGRHRRPLSSLLVRQTWRTPLRDKMSDMARRRTACPSLVMLDSTTRDVTLHAQMSLLEQGSFELDSLENMVSTPSKDVYS